ncbi:hypothetical protein ABW20_dc0105990 [Dactylellina cionopaga]|nr:hypothetical protein ABW20_dc0105990 [Dactylellina cionopaga]
MRLLLMPKRNFANYGQNSQITVKCMSADNITPPDTAPKSRPEAAQESATESRDGKGAKDAPGAFSFVRSPDNSRRDNQWYCEGTKGSEKTS